MSLKYLPNHLPSQNDCIATTWRLTVVGRFCSMARSSDAVKGMVMPRLCAFDVWHSGAYRSSVDGFCHLKKSLRGFYHALN